MNSLYRSFIVLLAIAVTACAAEQSRTLAGNDEDRDIGLGGTGLVADASNGLGGTGIIGVITGFGSIFVNGIEIEYDSKTPFTIDGEVTASQKLQIGDVVEVLTTDSRKHTRAQIINVRHEIVGQVTAVNRNASSFTVLGQTVLYTDKTESLPEPGATVAVSGFRINDRTIQATRVVRAMVRQTLLRTHTELPFNKIAARWLVQTQVNQGQIAIQFGGDDYTLSVQPNTTVKTPVASGVKILLLHKSASDKLEIDEVVDPERIQRGRLTPIQHPDYNMMQRPTPMNMRMQPGMYRNGS